MSTHAEKIEAAKRKAQEMKAAAAAKRAAKEAAAASGGDAPPAADAQPGDEDRFIMGAHNLILVDWDDTLFPTSAWKARVEPDAAQPLRDRALRRELHLQLPDPRLRPVGPLLQGTLPRLPQPPRAGAGALAGVSAGC